jgi:hypothetical protein
VSGRTQTWHGAYAVYVFSAASAAAPVMHLGARQSRPPVLAGGPVTHHTLCGRVTSEYHEGSSTAGLATVLQYRHARLFCRPCATCEAAGQRRAEQGGDP